VLYRVLAGCVFCSALLIVPRMDISSPGEGVMASQGGRVDEVAPDRIVVEGRAYRLNQRGNRVPDDGKRLIWPMVMMWQEPLVEAGDVVARRQLLARGVTHVYFQANRDIFTGIVLALGLCMGVGMGAVYKYIPTYFPADVGVVGGVVGVIGGLGGFLFPILFGSMLKLFGLWTSCWLLFFALSLICLVWLHRVVQRLMAEAAPEVAHEIEGRELARDLEGLAREIEVLADRVRRRRSA
jgi:NNP family nitrate/nitrite transporter-like MFS transporter